MIPQQSAFSEVFVENWKKYWELLLSKWYGLFDCRVVESLVEETFKLFTSKDSFRIDSLVRDEIEKTASQIVKTDQSTYMSPQNCETELENLLKMIDIAVVQVKMDTRE